MKRAENIEPTDPDYEAISVDRLAEINRNLDREDARDQTVQKIQKIIHDQFSFEVELKEKEVTIINRRIHETRGLLDRLRACILAGYYGYGKSSEVLRRNSVRKEKTRVGTPRSKQTCLSEVMKWKQSLPSSLKEHPVEEIPSSKAQGDMRTPEVCDGCYGTQQSMCLGNCKLNGHLNLPLSPLISSDLSCSGTCHISKSPTKGESRFYVKRRIIVGNTSKYILPEHRESNDRSTHKWMVYVRGPKNNSDLQNFICKVWFLLHPSYQPNDLVEVCKPPFQVTRRGWGEFPVRVQLHFVENKNKRVDIIHHLKLDKTYTGLQTLGAETHVDIELDRRNFDCKSSQNVNLVQSVEAAGKTTGNVISQQGTTANNSNSNNLDLLNELSCQDFSDHSYSVPVTKLQKLHCDDGLKYPTPPTSTPGSRCSSPDITYENLFSTLAYETEAKLRKSVQQFPIINPNCNVVTSPYCASSFNQYLQWNVGKRLAAEWQRSLAVKNHVCCSNAISSLSTKDVMNYCRLHGYTPMATILAEGMSLCKVCGEETSLEEDHENEVPLNSLIHEKCVADFQGGEILGSLSNADEFLHVVQTSEAFVDEPNVQRNELIEVDDIDVVSIDKETARDSLNSRLLFLSVQEELEWVRETAAEVNVHLQGTNLDGVRAPVTTAMLFKACGLFLEDILRKANRFTWKTPLQIPKTKCILPTHVKKALEVIPHCDFLTNKYLGVEQESSPG